jgi:hypothetical protein
VDCRDDQLVFEKKHAIDHPDALEPSEASPPEDTTPIVEDSQESDDLDRARDHWPEVSATVEPIEPAPPIASPLEPETINHQTVNAVPEVTIEAVTIEAAEVAEIAEILEPDQAMPEERSTEVLDELSDEFFDEFSDEWPEEPGEPDAITVDAAPLAEPDISPETIDAAGLEMDDRELDYEREPELISAFEPPAAAIEEEPIVTVLDGEEPPYFEPEIDPIIETDIAPDDEFAEFEATPVLPRSAIATPVSTEVVTAIGSPPTRSAVAEDEDWDF